MNFIDWDNEFDAVYGGESDSDEKVSKIKGMSMEIFKAILNEEKEFDLQILNGLQHKFYD